MQILNNLKNYIKKRIPTDPKLLRREIKSYIMITLCLCLYAFGLVTFIINSEIVSGGVNGISTLIFYATGRVIPVAVSAFVINMVLLLIGFKILGKGFGFKTIWAIFGLSIFISMWTGIIHTPVLADDKFLSAVIGGALIGISIGTAFNYGGSTGGTDIVALIVSKFRNVGPGRVILLCDIFIISSSFIVFHFFNGHPVVDSVRVVLYGFVTMGVTSYTIDLLVLGSRSSVQILINSAKHQQIAEMITHEKNRGVTLLNAEGYYSKKETRVLFVVVRKYELQPLMKRIKDIDANAFMSVTNALGVFGNGFENIK
ncbi:MAG: YitT family protein [Bacteroidales bacterium]|nr:YitT family protein [Bacteroidales bacterium]MDE7072581.1 YitT family protein [Bacteroidales bacterium]